uniref:DMT family transporter n=1 Tax=Pararhizobium sp. IMCC3301 TaxID=3067904 RepID=UPI0027428ECD|nr:DMT family transporter [Pararhizobium sp. IMCC3301]
MSDITLSKHDLAPFFSMTIAIFSLSLLDAGIKAASADLQTWQIVVMRYGFGWLFATAYFLLLARRTSLKDRMARLLSRQVLATSLLRSVFVVLTASCFFFALSQLPLARTVTIVFSAPLFMVLFSRLILGEPIPAAALAAIAFGFGGVLVIFGDALFQPLAGALIPMASALLASIFYALSIVLSRKHTAHTQPEEMVMLQSGFALVLALPFGFLPLPQMNLVVPDLQILLMFSGIGFLGTAGHLMIVWALKRESASRLGPIEYTNLIWAVIFGFLFFQELPSLHTLAGAVLVVLACLVAGRSKPPRAT